MAILLGNWNSNPLYYNADSLKYKGCSAPKPDEEELKYFTIGAARKVADGDENSPACLAENVYGLDKLRDAVLNDPDALPRIADRVYAEILTGNILRREILADLLNAFCVDNRVANIVAVTEALSKQEDRLVKILALRTPMTGAQQKTSSASQTPSPPSPPPSVTSGGNRSAKPGRSQLKQPSGRTSGSLFCGYNAMFGEQIKPAHPLIYLPLVDDSENDTVVSSSKRRRTPCVPVKKNLSEETDEMPKSGHSGQ